MNGQCYVTLSAQGIIKKADVALFGSALKRFSICTFVVFSDTKAASQAFAVVLNYTCCYRGDHSCCWQGRQSDGK